MTEPPSAGDPSAGPGSIAFLAEGAGAMPGAFARPAPVPAMPWIERPQHGWIAGIVAAATPADADGVIVKVKRAGFGLFRRTRAAQSDGNGHFGLTTVKPGQYRVWIDGGRSVAIDVRVVAGQVTHVDLPLR